MCHSRPQWLLLLACYLLWPSLLFGGTHSTPVQPARRGHGQPCAHNTIAELIKKSPVIVKALGAHIFSDDDGYANDLSELVAAAVNGNGADLPKWQNLQNNFLTSATLQQAGAAIRAATATTATTTTTTTAWHGSESEARRPLAAGKQPESILITLTPETIYKGASLLKMTPGAESAARSGSAGGSSSGSSRAGSAGSYGSTAAESAYQYEGQLNATLQPLSCFDGNLLKILPTELIAFGKLVTVQQQQQQPQPPLVDPQQQQQQQQPHAAQPIDILYISINGLHRWTPQFENHIWKHLGWDDWSDFTLCSVTCGKGVQQRFRRCLLDNPMVNLNMQLNLNTVSADDDDPDTESDAIDGDDVVDADVAAAVAMAVEGSAGAATRINADNDQVLPPNASNGNDDDDGAQQNTEIVKGNVKAQQQQMEKDAAAATTITEAEYNNKAPLKANLMKTLHVRGAATTTTTTTVNRADNVAAKVVVADDGEVMRTFEGSFDNSMENEWTQEKSLERRAKAKRTQRQRKRRKSTKNYSTMFCEGYNIEQRNCNTFECSDDISDLLKFYKKYPLPEDAATNVAAMQSPPTDANTATTMGATSAVTELLTATVDTAASASASAMSAGATSATAAGSSRGSTNANAAVGIVTLAGVGASALPSSTPANMGYIRSWRNALNFTIMLTLRVKNDSQAATTIFSIRNATHNLYLESCKDGLRLYLERDSTTEMLPVKFNLYDYRWHQVAISIQNGDFISIYVDCSWTNSFVVSKRLYSLPLDADVEIGRGFNGEMQQLLVLPDNQERHQCSNKRTSINEVKRYIIDTFIDDYGN